jgi:leader peptidase (prepilin peptidase)/N-methyltransferase
MGFGDVKLAIFLGIALGLKLVWVAVFLGVLLGGIVSIFLLFGYKKDLKTKLPFGTFLALGAFIAIFYGSPLLKWYLAILGI